MLFPERNDLPNLIRGKLMKFNVCHSFQVHQVMDKAGNILANLARGIKATFLSATTNRIFETSITSF